MIKRAYVGSIHARAAASQREGEVPGLNASVARSTSETVTTLAGHAVSHRETRGPRSLGVDVSRALAALVTYPVRSWLASLAPRVESRCKADIHYF